jgi:hypothetical protein
MFSVQEVLPLHSANLLFCAGNRFVRSWQTQQPDLPCRRLLRVHAEGQGTVPFTYDARLTRACWRQGRLCKRVRLLLRYTAGTGLINQHYSHISVFALAAVLGAEVVLPPGVRPMFCSCCAGQGLHGHSHKHAPSYLRVRCATSVPYPSTHLPDCAHLELLPAQA